LEIWLGLAKNILLFILGVMKGLMKLYNALKHWGGLRNTCIEINKLPLGR